MNSIIQWSPGVTLEAVERQVILAAWRFYKKNKTQTSNALGISVRTLETRIKQYDEDDVKQKEMADARKREKDEWLRKSRGVVHDINRTARDSGPNPYSSSQSASPTLPNGRGEDFEALSGFAEASSPQVPHGGKAQAGVHVQPIANAAPEHPVSVQERQEVQTVLPPKATGNHKSGRR